MVFLCHASLGFQVRVRVRVRVLGLGFSVRVRVRVSITGSVSYLNAKFVVLLAFVAPSLECRETYFQPLRSMASSLCNLRA